MTLWRFELKKILFTQKGIWILSACLICKLALLSVFPEMKDSRIVLTQKQYDKYLEQLHGENTPEKSAFIKEEYAFCVETLSKQKAMEREYQQGALSEEDWRQYTEELDQARLHQNAAKIFAEKEEQFEAQSTSLPPAHYIYEYGWQTVFTLQLFPDFFLLFGIVLLTAQCFSSEMTNGVLPMLLAARNGRSHFFSAKLSALLTVCLFAALASGAVEVGIFQMRGWLNDSTVPLYSINLFAKECPLNLSLRQGYLLSLGIRLCATLLFAAMIYGLSVWVRNIINLLSVAVGILAIPFLFSGFGGAGLLFTHIGLLCGSRMLLLLGTSGYSLVFPLICVAIYSCIVIVLAGRRYEKGL